MDDLQEADFGTTSRLIRRQPPMQCPASDNFLFARHPLTIGGVRATQPDILVPTKSCFRREANPSSAARFSSAPL